MMKRRITQFYRRAILYCKCEFSVVKDDPIKTRISCLIKKTFHKLLCIKTRPEVAFYRKYCEKASNCLPTFTSDSNSITLNGQGIYHITAVFVGAGTVAGDLTIEMYDNGDMDSLKTDDTWSEF